MFSATEGNGDAVEPGLKPLTSRVCRLGEPIFGDPSRSELPLCIRTGTILLGRGEPGRWAEPRSVRRGEGVGEVVEMRGWPRGVDMLLLLGPALEGVLRLMLVRYRD